MPGYNFNMLYSSTGSEVPAGQIIAAASNIRVGSNPEFTAANFLAIYPQFKATTTYEAGTGYDDGLDAPDALFDAILAQANAKIQQARWHSQWLLGMCNYIAHSLTLYKTAAAGDGSPTLIKTSKSVGDISVGYDASSVMQDLAGYADLKSTTYGVQLASAARLIGLGGMAIW